MTLIDTFGDAATLSSIAEKELQAMLPLETVGRWLMVVGAAIVLVGIVVFLLSKIPFLNRLGQLPGDIVYQSPDKRFTIVAPIVSSILISLILTLILNILLRILKR